MLKKYCIKCCRNCKKLNDCSIVNDIKGWNSEEGYCYYYVKKNNIIEKLSDMMACREIKKIPIVDKDMFVAVINKVNEIIDYINKEKE